MHEEGTRDERLTDALAALANPMRLALLRKLRTPQALGDIDLKGASPEGPRPISRQGVKEHLTRLMDLGVVTAIPSEGDARSPVLYVTNHQAIFSIAEEMRLLARNRPAVEPQVETVRATGGAKPALRRDCLVLVKGPDEGRVFDLAPPPGDASAMWAIGRRRTAHVCLDFDAHVSADHAAIDWDGRHHHLRDLPTSRNGTTVNFGAVTKEAPVRLAHGDLVGVGRTLLLYRH